MRCVEGSVYQWQAMSTKWCQWYPKNIYRFKKKLEGALKGPSIVSKKCLKKKFECSATSRMCPTIK